MAEARGGHLDLFDIQVSVALWPEVTGCHDVGLQFVSPDSEGASHSLAFTSRATNEGPCAVCWPHCISAHLPLGIPMEGHRVNADSVQCLLSSK